MNKTVKLRSSLRKNALGSLQSYLAISHVAQHRGQAWSIIASVR
jgi:hypothetical protein